MCSGDTLDSFSGRKNMSTFYTWNPYCVKKSFFTLRFKWKKSKSPFLQKIHNRSLLLDSVKTKWLLLDQINPTEKPTEEFLKKVTFWTVFMANPTCLEISNLIYSTKIKFARSPVRPRNHYLCVLGILESQFWGLRGLFFLKIFFRWAADHLPGRPN